MHVYCHICDRPVEHDPDETRRFMSPVCPPVDGVEWHDKVNLSRCGPEGRVVVTDAQGHRWEALYFVENGTMFVSMRVDGHDIMEPHLNTYIDDKGTLRFAGVDSCETMRQVTGEQEDYDDIDDYQRRYEEYEAGKTLVLCELVELAKTMPSPVFDGSVWEEMLAGERRYQEQARKDAMEQLAYRIEESLYTDYPLTGVEKADVLRKVAERLEV